MILFGTAGVSDNNTAEFIEIIKRVTFAVSMIGLGVWGKYAVFAADKKMKERYKSRALAAINCRDAAESYAR